MHSPQKPLPPLNSVGFWEDIYFFFLPIWLVQTTGPSFQRFHKLVLYKKKLSVKATLFRVLCIEIPESIKKMKDSNTVKKTMHVLQGYSSYNHGASQADHLMTRPLTEQEEDVDQLSGDWSVLLVCSRISPRNICHSRHITGGNSLHSSTIDESA